jgi:hypothetical protein
MRECELSVGTSLSLSAGWRLRGRHTTTDAEPATSFDAAGVEAARA